MQQIKKKRGIFSIFLPFLIYYAVSYVVQMIAVFIWLEPKFPELMQMDPKLLTPAFFMENYMPYLMEQFMRYLSVITIVVSAGAIPIFILLFRSDMKYEKMIGISANEKKPLSKYIAIIGIAIPLVIAATNIITLSSLSAYSEAYQETSKLLYEASFEVQLIGYGLIVPIAEELMFRGLIYRRFMYMGSKRRAMIFSALIFAVYHGNIVQGIYGFIVGCLAVYIYEKYGSIKAPILLHAVMNATSVIATEYNLFGWIFHDAIRMAAVTVVCAAVGSSMFVFMQHICNNENVNEKDVPLT